MDLRNQSSQKRSELEELSKEETFSQELNDKLNALKLEYQSKKASANAEKNSKDRAASHGKKVERTNETRLMDISKEIDLLVEADEDLLASLKYAHKLVACRNGEDEERGHACKSEAYSKTPPNHITPSSLSGKVKRNSGRGDGQKIVPEGPSGTSGVSGTSENKENQPQNSTSTKGPAKGGLRKANNSDSQERSVSNFCSPRFNIDSNRSTVVARSSGISSDEDVIKAGKPGVEQQRSAQISRPCSAGRRGDQNSVAEQTVSPFKGKSNLKEGEEASDLEANSEPKIIVCPIISGPKAEESRSKTISQRYLERGEENFSHTFNFSKKNPNPVHGGKASSSHKHKNLESSFNSSYNPLETSKFYNNNNHNSTHINDSILGQSQVQNINIQNNSFNSADISQIHRIDDEESFQDGGLLFKNSRKWRETGELQGPMKIIPSPSPGIKSDKYRTPVSSGKMDLMSKSRKGNRTGPKNEEQKENLAKYKETRRKRSASDIQMQDSSFHDFSYYIPIYDDDKMIPNVRSGSGGKKSAESSGKGDANTFLYKALEEERRKNKVLEEQLRKKEVLLHQLRNFHHDLCLTFERAEAELNQLRREKEASARNLKSNAASIMLIEEIEDLRKKFKHLEEKYHKKTREHSDIRRAQKHSQAERAFFKEQNENLQRQFQQIQAECDALKKQTGVLEQQNIFLQTTLQDCNLVLANLQEEKRVLLKTNEKLLEINREKERSFQAKISETLEMIKQENSDKSFEKVAKSGKGAAADPKQGKLQQMQPKSAAPKINSNEDVNNFISALKEIFGSELELIAILGEIKEDNIYRKNTAKFVECMEDMVESIAPEGCFEEKPNLKLIWKFIKNLLMIT